MRKKIRIPPLLLAPMAELTHAAFRQLVAEIGGCNLFFTEMLNTRIVSCQALDKDIYVKRAFMDFPLVAQLVGNDIEKVVRSIKRLEDIGYQAFDINMGCTRKAIMRHGWGLALMEDQVQAIEVVRAARQATSRPLFVKLRSGKVHDVDRLLKLARAFERIGVDAITLHPRALCDGFKRPSRWEEIAILKSQLSIPVFGNGDVATMKDAKHMYEQTRCSAIMVGRAAVVRPWIFWEIQLQQPWPGDPLWVLERMAYLTDRFFPEAISSKRFWYFCSWYLRNWDFHQYLLGKIRGMDNLWQMLRFLVREICSGRYPRVKEPVLVRL